jgi:hypothetical protein|tara:strand:- start:233 stop:469 length:237 start_codon:yes stop_codon:yes gene_type:complete
MPEDLVSDVVLEENVPVELEFEFGTELTFEEAEFEVAVSDFVSTINSESAFTFTLKTNISGTAKNINFNLLIVFPFIN